jgi:hypothetical protein
MPYLFIYPNGREDRDEEDDKDDEKDRRLEEEDDQQQEDDIVTSIVRNCGSKFYTYGIDLSNVDMDEAKDALHQLSLHIRIEKAIASGAYDFNNINYSFDEDNDDNQFYNLLSSLDISEDELEDGDIMNIQLAIAVKNGSLKEYLQANAAYGTVNEDWEGTIQGFFYSLGAEDVDLEDISPYLAADIYNIAYDLEELGCQKAMLSQFGKKGAKKHGYLETFTFTDFMNSAAEKGVTPGQIVGIVLACILGFVAMCLVLYKNLMRQAEKKAQGSRRRPLLGGTAV